MNDKAAVRRSWVLPQILAVEPLGLALRARQGARRQQLHPRREHEEVADAPLQARAQRLQVLRADIGAVLHADERRVGDGRRLREHDLEFPRQRRAQAQDDVLHAKGVDVDAFDDEHVVKGINVYPLGVQDVILSLRPALTGEFQIVLAQPPPITDPPLIRVEYSADVRTEDLEALRSRLERRIRDLFVFAPRVELLPAGTLPRTERKAKRLYRQYLGEHP